MNSDVSLVHVTEEDADAINELMKKVYEDELRRWFQGHEDELKIPTMNVPDAHKYHRWNQGYYKILYKNELAGVILIYTTGREHGRIDRFYISPEEQSRGIGSSVLAQMEERYPNVTKWTLETVQRSPRNHHFYEKNGYQLVEEDEEERYYCKRIKTSADMRESYHEEENLEGGNYRDSNYANTDWNEINFWHSRFSDANLSDVVFENSNLSRSRFTNVNLSNTVFGDSRMNGAEICHANLGNVYMHDVNQDPWNETAMHMERCNWTGSRVEQCNLQNVSFENCNMEGATIDGIPVSELLECYQKQGKKL